MNLVVGSNGLLGGLIARKLLAKGAPVRVMVRQASSIAGAHAVTGDLKDRASLDAACRGVTTVITTANSARRGGADNVESVDLAGNRALIDAADQAGVRQFIFVSVADSRSVQSRPAVRRQGENGRAPSQQRHGVDDCRAAHLHGRLVPDADRQRARRREAGPTESAAEEDATRLSLPMTSPSLRRGQSTIPPRCDNASCSADRRCRGAM
jgi:hypothetical protein